nr:hypothetical protein HK105_006439 [Polyrhizophydium stewartii]
MGIPHAQKVWQLARDVASGGKLADPIRMGALPHTLKYDKRILPTLMHGKRIRFGEQVSEKGKNRSRRAWLPNVVYRPLYSRALDMMVWTRLSTQALREIEDAGGFDEYMVTVSEQYMTCDIARMYRARIMEQYGANARRTRTERPAGIVGCAKGHLAEERAEMLELLGRKYGEEYAK